MFQSNDEDYNGPNPIELLSSVFQHSSCTSLVIIIFYNFFISNVAHKMFSP